MADLIDREALLDESRKTFRPLHELLKEAPRVDAEPVRYAACIPSKEKDEWWGEYYICKECTAAQMTIGPDDDPIVPIYCSCCGAKLDLEVEVCQL